MGKMIELIPGTPDWHEYRASRIGASDSSVIMGISPYKTEKQLYDEKIMGVRQADNPSMKRGREREQEAIKWAENYFNTILCSRVIEHNDFPWKFATVDGIDPSGKLVVEVKWASKEVHELAKEGKVVDYYLSQVMSQMACCNVEYMFFLSCYQEKDKPTEFVLVEVYRDEDYIDNMISKEKEWYIKHIVMMEEPELTDRDYEIIESDQFDICCSEYLRICKEIAVLEKEKKVMQTLALAITNDRSSKSGSFKATKFKVKGSVDYSSIDILKDVNLDLYRKESREQWKISNI